MIDGLAFHPYGLKNLKNPGKERKAREILSKNRAFRAELSGLMERQITQKVEEKLDQLISEQQKISSRFEGWKEVQEGIAKRHRSIEFRRSGVMSYRLVEIVKDSGKEVYNVSFKKMNGELVPGGARQLNIKTDDSFEIPYPDLKRHMGLDQ